MRTNADPKREAEPSAALSLASRSVVAVEKTVDEGA
jgi:hypothetical protein